MIPILAILLLLLLAWFNGANDAGKGVATLACAGELSPRRALGYGVLATFAGALCALLWGHALLMRFSGKGLVPDEVAAAPEFLLAAGLGALVTVAAAMAGGGWFAGQALARRVSTDLCDCTPAQGCGAHWVSAARVIAHTPLGLPVSTTHVTLGAVAGAGTAGARLNRSLFGGFLIAWVITLPVAAALAAASGSLLGAGL